MFELSFWGVLLFSSGWILVALLALMLWSARCQRPTRIVADNVDPLPDGLSTIEALTGSQHSNGNRLEILQDQALFTSLLDEIANATETIHLESYVWWRGAICERFATALAQRARDGIEVRVLLDALGAWKIERRLVDRMRRAGCKLCFYHAFTLRSFGRLNKRDHRKLAVIDGRRAYVFGHGFAEEWDHETRGDRAWRDTAARVEGPAVNALQAVFAQTWMGETSEVLAGGLYFPEPERAGDVAVHVVASSPRGGVSSSSLLYRLMICAARREVLIQNPYFAPPPEVVELLVGAIDRGVRVRILTAGPRTDSHLVRWAGHFVFPDLLRGGAEIHEFQPTLNHQKIMVVDREWCYLGSANFDDRSFDINAEVGLGILDTGVCDLLAEAFERDLQRAHRMTPERWRRRPLRKRAVEWAAYQIREQL
jgi:cardiolipin synthase